jgi:hypothetical protein
VTVRDRFPPSLVGAPLTIVARVEMALATPASIVVDELGTWARPRACGISDVHSRARRGI